MQGTLEKKGAEVLNTASLNSPTAWWQEALRYKHSTFELSILSAVDKSLIAFLICSVAQLKVKKNRHEFSKLEKKSNSVVVRSLYSQFIMENPLQICIAPIYDYQICIVPLGNIAEDNKQTSTFS